MKFTWKYIMSCNINVKLVSRKFHARQVCPCTFIWDNGIFKQTTLIKIISLYHAGLLICLTFNWSIDVNLENEKTEMAMYVYAKYLWILDIYFLCPFCLLFWNYNTLYIVPLTTYLIITIPILCIVPHSTDMALAWVNILN